MKKKALTYYLIFLLTFFDVLFTAIGIRSGFIEEGNPLLKSFVEYSLELSMISVLLIIAIILIFLYRVRNKIGWLSYALCGIISVKVFVIGMHLNWMLLYFLSIT
jgi:hypothetical protein